MDGRYILMTAALRDLVEDLAMGNTEYDTLSERAADLIYHAEIDVLPADARSLDERVVDTVTDVLLYAAARGCDVDAVLRSARYHYDCEA